MINVISKNTQPAMNWFLYNSISGSGKIEIVQETNQFPTKDLPERRQLVEKI
jgi:hypothetical protein